MYKNWQHTGGKGKPMKKKSILPAHVTTDSPPTWPGPVKVPHRGLKFSQTTQVSADVPGLGGFMKPTATTMSLDSM